MGRHIVNIKKIAWIDKDISEAEVLFETSGKEIWAFCHPCDFVEGDTASARLSIIEEDLPDHVFWSENKWQKKEIISSNDDRLRYYCYGQLKSIHPVVIDCGAITICFGDWINDERVIGSYVYFVVSRLDILKVDDCL